MKDWQIRALKTFGQCFGGVLIPEIVMLLNNLPADITTTWKILFPVVCSGIAAGISAVWNIVLEELKKNNKELEEDMSYLQENLNSMTYQEYIRGNINDNEDSTRQD